MNSSAGALSTDITLLLGVDLIGAEPSACGELLHRARRLAFDAGACEAECGGRPLWLFADALALLRVCAALATSSAGVLRIVVHADRVELVEQAPAWQVLGAPRWTVQTPGADVIDALRRIESPIAVRFSPTAADLARRAAVGCELPPLQWRVGDLDPELQPAPDWVGLHFGTPLTGDGDKPAIAMVRSEAIDPELIPTAGHPLPDLPHWWLLEDPDNDSPRRARLRHQKTGQLGCAWFAGGDGAQELRERIAAQRAAQGTPVAELLVPLSDCRLDRAPRFVVAHWIGIEPLIDRWQRQPLSPDALFAAFARLFRQLAAAQAQGLAHGQIDDRDLFFDSDRGALRITGLRRFELAADAAEAAGDDAHALLMLLFRLALGGPDRHPGPFWEADLVGPEVAALIRACLDPSHPAPVRGHLATADAIDDLLQRRTRAASAPAPSTRRWWRRRADQDPGH